MAKAKFDPRMLPRKCSRECPRRLALSVSIPYNLRLGNATLFAAIVPLSTIGTRYGNSVSTPLTSKIAGKTWSRLTSQYRQSKSRHAQHINFGVLIRQWISRSSLDEPLNFPEFSGISLERVVGIPKSHVRGKIKLICWPAVNQREKADTEIQYRPHIVDTDIDCGHRFCGPHFRDSYTRAPSKLCSRFIWSFFTCSVPWPKKMSVSPKAIPEKAALPDFPFFFLCFSRADPLHVPRLPFSASFLQLSLCVFTMPGVDPHHQHNLWIEHEGIWDDWLCQGWPWVQRKMVQRCSNSREFWDHGAATAVSPGTSCLVVSPCAVVGICAMVVLVQVRVRVELLKIPENDQVTLKVT